jgi:hypothetical protein
MQSKKENGINGYLVVRYYVMEKYKIRQQPESTDHPQAPAAFTAGICSQRVNSPSEVSDYEAQDHTNRSQVCSQSLS